MARTAFSHSLFKEIPLQIESITIWNQYLYVGSAEGQLLCYSPDDPRASRPRHETGFSSKPVRQLQGISCGGYDFLLAICDEQLCLYQIPHLDKRIQCLTKTKGASAFAVRLVELSHHSMVGGGPSSSSHSQSAVVQALILAVAVKKKVFLFRMTAGDPKFFIERGELPPLPDTVRTMSFCGSERTLFLGLRSKYMWCRINQHTPALSELEEKSSLGKGSVPTILVVEKLSQVLFGRDSISIFFDFDGKPARNYGLTWSEPPLAIGFCFPYVIGLLSKCVEIRTVFEAQRSSTSATSSSTTAQGRHDVLVQTIPHMTKGIKLLAWQDNQVYLAANKTLVRLVPFSLLEQVQHLLGSKLFEDALSLCENIPSEQFSGDTFSARELEREQRITNIKVMHAYHRFQAHDYGGALRMFFDHHVSVLQVIGLYHGMLPPAVRQQFTYPIEVPELHAAQLTAAYQALISYLAEARPMFLKDYHEDDASIAMSLQDNYSSVTDPAVIIDTTLFKIVAHTQKTCPGFLQRPNDVVACHVKECEKLGATRHELVGLYRAKKLHRQALNLLIGRAKMPDSMQHSIENIITYLCDLGGEHWPLIIQTLESLMDILSAAQQQRSLSSEFKMARLLPIFSRPRPEGHELPQDKVLETIRDRLPNLLIDFLENAVFKEKSQLPQYHDELALAYLEKLKAFMAESSSYGSGGGRYIAPGTEPDPVGPLRRKLLDFLENSTQYTAPKMVTRFPNDRLLEERAILLSKMEQHEKALDIYANQLHNYQMAEAYCDRIYQASPEKARDVYLSLLAVSLEQAKDDVGYSYSSSLSLSPAAAAATKNPALAFLSKYYTRFDTASALMKLDADIPVADLLPFLQAVLRSNNKKRRNSAVVHSLVKSEKVQTQLKLIQARRTRIVITEEKMCPVCSKRLGNKNSTFFTRYPDGTVCHVMCPYVPATGGKSGGDSASRTPPPPSSHASSLYSGGLSPMSTSPSPGLSRYPNTASSSSSSSSSYGRSPDARATFR